MSMDLFVYTKNLSSDLIPTLAKRFADYGMTVDFHPDFQFDEEIDKGFLPIKFNISNSYITSSNHSDQDPVSGFELYFDDYNYQQEVEELSDADEKYVASQELDNKLKTCNKTVSISFKAGDESEFTLSAFFATFLTELTDGIMYDPQTGKYYDGESALRFFPKSVDAYEEAWE